MADPVSLSNDRLHQMLDDLLSDAAPTGALESDKFWHFMAAVARGRGITETLHASGLQWADKAPPSPKKSLPHRQFRAYHIGLLAQLLMDAGRMGGASVLPGNFNHSLIASDLISMLGGKGGLGEADPLILTSGRGGKATIRRHARNRVVGAILWRAEHSKKSVAAVRASYLPDVVKTTWDSWMKEAKEYGGNVVEDAKKAGRAGDVSSPYAVTDDKLRRLVALAHELQRRRKSL